ncbi:MAG: hypothetical protein ABI779_20015 [Acidobacteriota bacterium]
MQRVSAVCALLVLTAVSSFAQSRPGVGTVVDINGGRLQVEYDDQSRVAVETDSVSTVYYGFGTVIAGKPEIFTGSSGLSNVRIGDRIEIRGSQRGEGVIKADRITLAGRNVAAGPVGVGTTRDPASMSTPTDQRTSGSTVDTSGSATEGTIRQINDDDGRIILVTTQRRMITVRTYRNTPVTYRGATYNVSNLEVGDRIRVEAEPRSGQSDEIAARRITVLQSVQEGGTAPTGGNVTTLTGRVTRIEPGLDRAYVDDGRDEIRVDMNQGEDTRGEVIHARDLRVGDRVQITGSFNRVGDIFNASTVRFTDPDRNVTVDDPYGGTFDRPALVTTGGSIVETLEDAATLGLRETDTNRVVRIWVAPDFMARLKAGTYAAASTLREKDTVVIQAYRDARGNLIAQTIRVRNR